MQPALRLCGWLSVRCFGEASIRARTSSRPSNSHATPRSEQCDPLNRTTPIHRAHFKSRPFLDLAITRHEPHRLHLLKCLSTPSPRVHSQCTSQTAWNALHSSPARPASRAELAMWFRRAPAPQCKTFSRTSICVNPSCRRQITPECLLANHQIRTPPEQKHRHFTIAAPHHCRQIRPIGWRPRLLPVRRPQRRALGQRFIFQHLTFRAHQSAQCLCVGCACHV